MDCTYWMLLVLSETSICMRIEVSICYAVLGLDCKPATICNCAQQAHAISVSS